MKFRIALLALAICCPIAYAQPSPGTMGTKAAPAEVYDHLLSNLQGEIVGAADAMPADKYNFAPTQGDFKGVRTFGEQVRHLAESNYNYFKDWGAPNYVDPKSIEKLTSKDDIMKALRDSYAFAHAAMNTMTADNAFEQMGARKQTRAGIAAFSMAHSMDHYGQLVEYLRMNGIIPPASRKSGM